MYEAQRASKLLLWILKASEEQQKGIFQVELEKLAGRALEVLLG